MTQPAPTPAAPPAPAAPAPVAGGTAAKPATPRKPRPPAWWRKPHILAAFALGLTLAEVVVFGLTGWLWGLAINVVVALTVWTAMLTWRRRGRGGLLDRIFGRSGSRARSRGAGSDRARGWRSLLPGGGRRARGGRGAGSGSGIGSGSRGRGGRLRSMLPGGGRRRAGGSGPSSPAGAQPGGGSGGSWRGRRRARRAADREARTHATYDGGHGGPKTDGKGKGKKGKGGKAAPETPEAPARRGKWLARLFGVDNPASPAATPDASAKPDDGKGKTAKPAPPAAGDPTGGGEPWNDPKYDPKPGGAKTPRPKAPAAIPVPRGDAHTSRGRPVTTPVYVDGVAFQTWARHFATTERAATAVAARINHSDLLTSEADRKHREAETAQQEATAAAARAQQAASDDRARLHAQAVEAAQEAAVRNHQAAEAAAEAKTAAERAAEAKSSFVFATSKLVAYGQTTVAAPELQAVAEDVLRKATTADTADQWNDVSNEAAGFEHVYNLKHGYDRGRVETPRNGPAAEAGADYIRAASES